MTTSPSCPKILAGCAREFGEIKTQLGHGARKMDEIHKAVVGPNGGLVVRVHDLEQDRKRRGRAGGWILGILGSIIAAAVTALIVVHTIKGTGK